MLMEQSGYKDFQVPSFDFEGKVSTLGDAKNALGTEALVGLIQNQAWLNPQSPALKSWMDGLAEKAKTLNGLLENNAEDTKISDLSGMLGTTVQQWFSGENQVSAEATSKDSARSQRTQSKGIANLPVVGPLVESVYDGVSFLTNAQSGLQK